MYCFGKVDGGCDWCKMFGFDFCVDFDGGMDCLGIGGIGLKWDLMFLCMFVDLCGDFIDVFGKVDWCVVVVVFLF